MTNELSMEQLIQEEFGSPTDQGEQSAKQQTQSSSSQSSGGSLDFNLEVDRRDIEFLVQIGGLVLLFLIYQEVSN